MPEWTGAFAGAGLYPNLPEDLYHRDVVPEGSLSVSGAKMLLPPSCPAKFDHARRHPHKTTKAMDLGTTVHALTLGTGADIAVLEFDSRRGNDYKAAEAEAIAGGKIPMLAKDHAEARLIADAVRADPEAGGFLAEGDAEVSMFWRDEQWGVWLRGRMDWLTYFGETPVIVDLKTTADASPQEFARSVDKYRYYMQDPHYRDGLAAALDCDPDDVDFVFIAVETEPPYLVMVHRLLPDDVWLGRECNAIAREHYRDCAAADLWPKWSQSINDLPLPPYARRRIESEINEHFN